jgi:hypothetical protein
MRTVGCAAAREVDTHVDINIDNPGVRPSSDSSAFLRVRSLHCSRRSLPADAAQHWQALVPGLGLDVRLWHAGAVGGGGEARPQAVAGEGAAVVAGGSTGEGLLTRLPNHTVPPYRPVTLGGC